MVGKPENSTNFAKTTDFNNILNDIINGKRQFNNLSKEENDTARRDRLLATGALVSRGNDSPDKEESQDQRNERQEKQVEEWAKKEGVWHDDALAFGKSFGPEMPGGQESLVYTNPKNGTVIKVKNTTQYHNLREFLDGIILHNTLFPETAYKVLGFGNDGEGFVAILEQPFVRGERPTQEQILDYIKEKLPNIEEYEKEIKGGRYKTSQTLLHDLVPRNAVITPNGNIAIIDAIIRPNIASEGKGGKRSDDYSVSGMPDSNILQFSTSSRAIFTFDDGTTVNTPFVPNRLQKPLMILIMPQKHLQMLKKKLCLKQ